MTPFETVKKKVLTTLATFQVANYSTIPVDYPGFHVVDIEKATQFFKVEVSLSSRNMDLQARKALRVDGMLYVRHFNRTGGGSSIFFSYSDALMTYLGLKTIDGVTYYEVQPYDKSDLEGFDSVFNAVRFTADYFQI